MSMSVHAQRDAHVRRRTGTVAAVVFAVPLAVVPTALNNAAHAAATTQLTWSTVVNAADLAPGSTRTFSSFNQPSVNADGLVAFRARTQGETAPVRGVFTRDMATGSSIATIARVGGPVPAPNNSDATFNEFPAFPRIGTVGSMVATRGQSTPVLTYTLPDGTDTKVGTSGVYATPGGALLSGATLLGNVSGYEAYAVPDAPPGTRFDQFPGAPAVDGSTIVFKGNYTVGTTGLTGVYFRDLGAGDHPVTLIAGASTRIPNQPDGSDVVFGSTAPPSAAGGRTVFSGWDNEAAPTMGGIYLAPTTSAPELTTVVGLGAQVPGQAPGVTFTNVGEGLSFDGRYVGFWASWGSQMRSLVLPCPVDGNQPLIAYCNETYPDGFATQVPVHQGVFVADTTTGSITPVMTTGTTFRDFLFWVFSGRPPGTGGGDEVTLEPARWRSSAFVAVSGSAGRYQVAFKAAPVEGGSGVYLTQGPESGQPLITVLDTSTAGPFVDASAPSGSVVTAIGIERDGFRGRWLTVNASMLDPVTSESWAGIYATRVPMQVAKEPQTITITSTPPTSPVPGGRYEVVAVAGSGLPVELSIDPATTGDSCTIAGSTVSFLHVGTCIVDADQPGDATYLPAPRVQQTIAVAAIATSVGVALTASPITVGQETHAVATISAASGTPAGSVRFVVDGQPFGAPVSVVAQQATSAALVGPTGQPLPAGQHAIGATFTPSDTTVYAGSSGSTTLSVTAVPVSATYKTDFTGVTLATVPDPGRWHMTGPYDAAVVTTATGNSALRISNAVTSGSFQDMIFSPTLPVAATETGPATTFTATFDLLPVRLQPGLRVTVSPDNGAGGRAGFLSIQHTARGVDLVIAGSYLDSRGRLAWNYQTIATNVNPLLRQTITMTVTKKVNTRRSSNNDTFTVRLKGKPSKTTTFEAYYQSVGEPNYQTDTLLFRVSEATGFPAAPRYLGRGIYVDNVSMATA